MSKLQNNMSIKHFPNLEKIVSNNTLKVENAKEVYRKFPKYKKKSFKKHRDEYISVSTQNLLSDMEKIKSLQEFFSLLLGIVLNKEEFNTMLLGSLISKEFVQYILKDNEFKNFVIYSLLGEEPKNIIGSNVISLLFLYVFKNKKITIIKIRNFLSLWIVKLKINFLIMENLTNEQKTIIQQLRTGIKEEKQKNLNPLNNIEYKKSNKHFSILDTVTSFIKIKYISGLNGSHRFHKSPDEHEREGHWRHYANGSKTWIPSTTVNKKSA